MSQYKKKLIEVALPLDAINKASTWEKSIRQGIRVRCTCGGRGPERCAIEFVLIFQPL